MRGYRGELQAWQKLQGRTVGAMEDELGDSFLLTFSARNRFTVVLCPLQVRYSAHSKLDGERRSAK